MENTAVINSFKRTNKHHNDPENYFARMQDLVFAYNFEDQPVKLFIMGDDRSGIRFRVECSDPSTRARLENVLRQYLVEQNA
ncbi:MAG TPA: hypothetical protein VGN64_06930 [Dyadobacter sp.]|jgi:hypothetical protein|nr:hypothetical protein [Dyadobacter sp.]